MKFLPLLLLLGGCANSLDNLYAQRTLCLQSKGECEALHVQINDIEARIALRDEMTQNAKTPCGNGYVAYCTDRMYGCGKTRTTKIKQLGRDYYCVSAQAVRDALRGIQ